MHRAIPKAALATVVAVLLVACSTAPPPHSVLGSSSPITAPAEPTATVPASPTVSPTAVLRADGMATVAAPGGLNVWSAPGTKKAKALKPALPAGARLFLTRGPRHANGFDWWEVQVEYKPGLSPLFGWIHASEADRPTLLPFAPDCPSSDAPVEREVTKSLGTLRALACFGGREVTLRGQLTCYSATIDSAVGGASWLGIDASCSIDDTFWLEGSVVTGLLHGVKPADPVVGRYEVRGHFDDPEAAGCSWIPFGSNTLLTPSGHPDPGAVIICRQAFVVTAVTKLP